MGRSGSSSAGARTLRRLVSQGQLTQAQANACEQHAYNFGCGLDDAIVDLGILPELELLKILGKLCRTQFLSTSKLERLRLSPALLKLLPAKVAHELGAFPVRYDGGQHTLFVLVNDPTDLELSKHLQFASRVRRVKLLLARTGAIRAAIALHYDGDRAAFRNLERYAGSMDSSASLSLPAAPWVSTPTKGPDHPIPAADTDRGPSSEPPRELPRAVPIAPVAGPGLDTAAQAPAGLPAPVAVLLGGQEATVPVSVLDRRAQGLAPLPPAGVAPEAAAPPEAAAAEPARIDSAVATHDAAATRAVPRHDYLETLNVLVTLLEQDRDELRGHSAQVCRICRRMGERLGLSGEEADALLTAAYLHDVGKSASPHLTAFNVAQYDSHNARARKSYLTPIKLFESVRLPKSAIKSLMHLYERYNGTGFPDRLSGSGIPLGSRVLAIVESYTDLTSRARNPAGRKLSAQEAWEQLAEHGGVLFDPNLIDLFRYVVLGDDLRAKLLSGSGSALLVEPDPEEATVLELRLIERGFDVTAVRDSQRALQEMAGTDFDVIVSEVELSPRDGFDLLRKIRETKGTAEVPFIFLTRHASSASVQKGFELGAADYITKPSAADVVALKIQQVLAKPKDRKGKRGVSGSLSEMSLPDVVQILFHGRKSGRLSISANRQKGSIDFSEGQIFGACFGELTGEEAFYAMLVLTSGEFELDPHAQPDQRIIQLPPESLLLEGMRRLDEANR